MIYGKKIYSKYLLIILLIGLLITGCDQNNIRGYEDDEDLSIDVVGEDHDILSRSEAVSDLVVNLYGIDNATSIILNDLVAIGVEMAEGSKFTNEIKETIIDTVLKNDSLLRQVLITDNKKLFEQIEGVVLSLMNGNPYDKQVKEIDKIVEKLKKE